MVEYITGGGHKSSAIHIIPRFSKPTPNFHVNPPPFRSTTILTRYFHKDVAECYYDFLSRQCNAFFLYIAYRYTFILSRSAPA